MSDKNQAPSTLQSYVDSATGAVQDAIGSLTGNSGQQRQGELNKTEAQKEHEASQATAKVGDYSVSSSGGVAKDDPNRSQGSWDQTIGSAKEAMGGLMGNEGLKTAGREQNQAGQQQEAKGQLNDLVGGMTGRAQGVVGGAMANVMGDGQGKDHYDQVRADGKAQQRGVEADLQKKADAEAAENK